MAIVQSIERVKQVASPPTIQDVTRVGGNLHGIVAEYEAAALPSGDVIELWGFFQGDRIHSVVLHHDALGAGVTLIVGDGGDTNRFLESTVATAAGTVLGDGIAGVGFAFGADDTMDIVTGVGASTGTIKVEIQFVPVGG